MRLELDADGHFADHHGDETELTMRLRGSWSGLVATLANLLAVDADPLLPYEIELDDQLLVDRDARVSYLTPILLRRLPQHSVEPRTEEPQTVTAAWDEDEDE